MMNIMSRLRIKKSLITVVLHSSNVFAIAKTRHQQMDSGCIFVDEVSAPHMCKRISPPYRRNWLWGSVYLNSYPLACSIVLISLFPSPFNIQMQYIFIKIDKV